MPDAVSAERHAGEIDALRIAVELRDGVIEGLHRRVRVLAEPLRIGRELRIDDDRIERMLSQRRSEADLFLPNTVGAALSGAVQKEDDRLLHGMFCNGITVMGCGACAL